MLITTAHVSIIISISRCSTWSPNNIGLEEQSFSCGFSLCSRDAVIAIHSVDKLEFYRLEYYRHCTDFEWWQLTEPDYTDECTKTSMEYNQSKRIFDDTFHQCRIKVARHL